MLSQKRRVIFYEIPFWDNVLDVRNIQKHPPKSLNWCLSGLLSGNVDFSKYSLSLILATWAQQLMPAWYLSDQISICVFTLVWIVETVLILEKQVGKIIIELIFYILIHFPKLGVVLNCLFFKNAHKYLKLSQDFYYKHIKSLVDCIVNCFPKMLI